MAYRLTSLLRNLPKISAINSRAISQYYPIDEHIFGLSDEQIQVIHVFVYSKNSSITHNIVGAKQISKLGTST
jgi:hypothetical protein